MSFVLTSNTRKPVSDPVSGNDTVLVTAFKKEAGLIRALSSLYGEFFKAI